MREFKVCLLGSGSVGKSALAIQFTDERFVESYDPTVEDCYKKIFAFKGEQVSLEIIDTAGTEQFTSMVELYIRNCAGFILVYDVTKKTSFDGLDAIKEMVWRVKKAKPRAPPPMVVVGNKIDMPDREVLLAKGHAKAKEWGASFLETSAKTRTKVDDIFFEVVRLLIKSEKKKGGCAIL